MYTPSNTLPRPTPWYTHRWPWFLMIGPVAVVLAGIFTGWIAFAQQDALVVDDYYKQGKAINQDLRRDRAAAALGLSFALRYDPATGKLSGNLLARDQPLDGAAQLRLVHSTRPELDIRVVIEPDSKGNFSIDLPMLERARWQVQVEDMQRDWRLHGGWKWPQEQAVHIKADPVQ